EKIKKLGFKIDSSDLSSFVAEKWKSLPQEQKEIFENIKQNLLQRRKATNIFRNRPPEAWTIFYYYVVKKIKQHGFQIDSSDFDKSVSEKWKSLPQDRKKIFENIKQSLQQAYNDNNQKRINSGPKSLLQHLLNTPDDEHIMTDDERMEGVEVSIKQTDYTIFLPLTTELQKYADKIGERFEKAEHNRRVCSVLLKRVNSAAGEVKSLRQLKNDYNWFFEKLQGVMKYFNEYRAHEFSMDRKFYSLIGEFEKVAEELTIALQNRLIFVKPKGQNIEDDKAINLDMRDMEKVI
ncbi:6630_t:CDS:2, partial [Ambispora leptoticha]